MLRCATWLTPGLPLGLFETVSAAVATSLDTEATLTSWTDSSGPDPDDDPFERDEVDLGFMCTPSYQQLAARMPPSVRLVGAAPVFVDDRNDDRPVYFAELVVRNRIGARSLADLGGARIGFNDYYSLSGLTALRTRLAQLDLDESFATFVPTGGHRRSLELMAEGTIDAASIDSEHVARDARNTNDEFARARDMGTVPGAACCHSIVVARQDPRRDRIDAAVVASGRRHGTRTAALSRHTVRVRDRGRLPMRPLVAVTGRHLRPGRISSWKAGALALPRGYTDALDRAGARPVVLPPPLSDPGDTALLLEPFAGLVLSGGADVDPARYGQVRHPSCYGVDGALDAFEAGLVDAALDAELPVLAICRGHQLLTVVLGGTLDQHITDRPGLLVHGDPASGPAGGVDHDVTIEPGTRLAEALSTSRCSVRSHHHQAVADLAPKAIASSWSDDGVNEGFELPEGWVVSVQWHPEATAAEDPIQQRLFDAFVAQC